MLAEVGVTRLFRVQQRAKKSHYQSRVFVCVSSDRADAVDRLLIIINFADCTYILGSYYIFNKLFILYLGLMSSHSLLR